MKRTLIHNATIVNEGQSVQGSVVIENGRIAEVLTNWKPLSAPCEEVIDATGCYLLPGIIDDHVHFRDPGLTHKADILTESRAAAAGGVTSIMDMPNTNPLTVTLDALNAKLDLLNEKCIVNHSCYFGATNNNYTKFDKLDKHRVCGIKLFMGSSTGNMLVDKMNSLLNIFNGTDMLIAAHCEDQETIKNNIEKKKKKYILHHTLKSYVERDTFTCRNYNHHRKGIYEISMPYDDCIPYFINSGGLYTIGKVKAYLDGYLKKDCQLCKWQAEDMSGSKFCKLYKKCGNPKYCNDNDVSKCSMFRENTQMINDAISDFNEYQKNDSVDIWNIDTPY